MVLKRLRWKSQTTAQGMVEFALVLPILLLVLYGVLEVGRLLFTYSTVVTAARQAVRYGSANGLISGEPQYKDCAGIKDAAENVDFLGVISPADIQISYAPTMSTSPVFTTTISNCPGSIPKVASGGAIQVTVSAWFMPIVPIVPLDPLHITSSSYRTILGKVEVTGASASSSGSTIIPPIIRKSFLPNPISAGMTTTLQFTITNSKASTDLTGVGFIDNFPLGMTRVIAPTALQCNGTVSSTATSVTLSGGSIAAGGACTVSINVTALTDGTYLNNSGLVTSANGGTGNSYYATLLVGSSSSIMPPSIVKLFLQTDIPLGANTTLRFTITNPNASIDLSGVGFTDLFPDDMTNVNVPGSQCGGTVSSTSDSVTLTGGSIAAGGTCNVSIRVTTSKAGNFTNTTGIVTSSNAGNGNIDEDTLTVTDPDLTPPTVSKSFSPFSIKKGTSSALTFFITNVNAKSGLTNITFTDIFPAGMKLFLAPVASQCNGTVTGTAGAGSFSLTGGSLSVGPFTSCTVTVYVTAQSDGNYTNPAGIATSVMAINGQTVNSPWLASTLRVTNNPPPTCTFSQARPTYDNIYPETVSWVVTNTSPSNQVIDRLVVFWDGGNLTRVTVDGSALLFNGDSDPTTLSIDGKGISLTPGSHTIVFSYPSPFSIYGKNFNATLYFSASYCPIISTGSWTVQ